MVEISSQLAIARATRRIAVVLPLLALFTPAAVSASDDEATPNDRRFAIHGYGTANYQSYDWETDPDRRTTIDIERLTIYPSLRLDPRAVVRSEIEFEHGGTGASIEYDKFEEFGEYEIEIEKGGEVLLEQIHVEYTARPWLLARLGRFKLAFGLASKLDEPSESFTATRSEVESAIIPVNWYENGIGIAGETGEGHGFRYALSLVNGLDSSGFSSASWVVRGHQKRFETVNAENLAVTGQLERTFGDESFAGASFYTGDSADNRPKPDLSSSARVTVYDLHAAHQGRFVTARALFIHGALENSDLVSRANRNLSNNLNAKRTPVGSVAEGWMAEAGLNLQAFIPSLPRRLDTFVRYESYDTMAEVEGDVFDNPRWDRDVLTAGLVWHAVEGVVIKAHHARRELGLAQDNMERTNTVGLGFEF